MMFRTRCYPVGGLTPLVAMWRNAQSSEPWLGAPSLAQWMCAWRPRVRRLAASYYLGLESPAMSLDAFVERALQAMAGELETCTAMTDDGLYMWVAVRTARAVIAQHGASQAALRARPR